MSVLTAACMMVPSRYEEPLKAYRPATRHTIAIEGFNVGGFQPTGYTTTTDFGTASAAGSGGHATGTYIGGGVTVQSQYVVSSEAETFRTLLAQTGCFRVVAPGGAADLVLVGQVQSQPDMGWTIPIQILEGLTITPLFGMPVPARGSGSASANVYDRNTRELVSSVNTGKVYLTGWTTIYTGRHDGQRGLALLRGMAMRDLAERLSEAVCAGHRG